MSLIGRSLSRLSTLSFTLTQRVPQRQFKKVFVSEFVRQHGLEHVEERRRQVGLDEPLGSETLSAKYTEVEESTAEWKYVERLFPPLVVPKPPENQHYPTPTGWQPPPERSPSKKYNVRRNRLLMYPVVLELKNGQTRQLTQLRLIEGDIWALEADIRRHLEELKGKRVFTQVHEVAGFIRFKGDHVNAVKEWLAREGF